MWTTAAWVIVSFNCVCCIVIETPQNSLVFVGQTTSFKCRTTSGSFVREWKLLNRSPGSNPLKIFSNWISSGSQLNAARYNVVVDEFGSGVLYANNTQLEDTGTYLCVVDVGAGGQLAQYSAELSVLASDLKCESSADDNSLPTEAKKENREIWCNISYAGNSIPVVTWFRNDHKITLPTDSEIRVDRTKWFHFNTTLLLNSSDNGMIFSCEIQFEPTNTNEANSNTRRATNIPGRKFTACVLSKDSRNISTEPDGSGLAPILLSLVVAVLALSVGGIALIRFKVLRLKRFRCADGSIPDIVQHADNIRNENEEQFFNSPSFQRQPPIYAQVNDHVAAPSPTITKSKVKQQQRAIVNEVNPEEGLYYLDLNVTNGLSQASRMIPPRHYNAPEFNQSEYTSIDHTEQPPPRPPKRSK